MLNHIIFTLCTIILCLVNLIKPSSITQQKNCGFIINPQFFIYKIHTFNYKIKQPYYPHTNRQFSKFFHTTSFQHEVPLSLYAPGRHLQLQFLSLSVEGVFILADFPSPNISCICMIAVSAIQAHAVRIIPQ